MNTPQNPQLHKHSVSGCFDFLESFNGGVYHITEVAEFEPICGTKTLTHQIVGGKITSYDERYVYYEEPVYDDRNSSFENKYCHEHICKKCLGRLLNNR